MSEVDLCSAWVGSPTNECGATAVARRGCRCPNGCLGEGDFDYACAVHLPGLASDEEYGCVLCRATHGGILEWFPVQMLASGVSR